MSILMLRLVNEPRRIMTFQIATRGDALRHTAGRIAVAVSLTVVMTAATMLLQLGTDLNASVGVGEVIFSTIGAAVAISALLAGGLSFRSALLMRDLTLARSELARISHTDQLTGLLNRRGFDAAAALGPEVGVRRQSAGGGFHVRRRSLQIHQ